MAHHVSKAHFAELVEKALCNLPSQFAKFLEQVPIEIRDQPTPRQLRSVGLGDDHLLLGLYHGRPLTSRNVTDSGTMPDVIYIFQEDIEQTCDSEPALVEQIRTTVLHEIGHHFGMSEEDLIDHGYG